MNPKLEKYIGRTGKFAVNLPTTKGSDTMQFRVNVTNARYAFGRTDLCIVPVGGTGEHWAKLDSVVLDPVPKNEVVA